MVILSWSADWFTADKAGRKKKSNASGECLKVVSLKVETL